MLSQVVQDALNDQINYEFSSSYSYLAMSAYCERQHFLGCAKWLLVQSREEYQHGMKLYHFMLARNYKVNLKHIAAPQSDFDSIPDVFETALRQEIDVTRKIEAVYELAFQEKSFAELVEMQWFITEQVEEERTARDLVAMFRLVKDDPPGLLELDRELARRGAGGESAPAGEE